jgi:hypothetical protein
MNPEVSPAHNRKEGRHFTVSEIHDRKRQDGELVRPRIRGWHPDPSGRSHGQNCCHVWVARMSHETCAPRVLAGKVTVWL